MIVLFSVQSKKKLICFFGFFLSRILRYDIALSIHIYSSHQNHIQITYKSHTNQRYSIAKNVIFLHHYFTQNDIISITNNNSKQFFVFCFWTRNILKKCQFWEVQKNLTQTPKKTKINKQTNNQKSFKFISQP